MEGLPFQFEQKSFWEFFCPVCKAKRRSTYWPSPRPKHYLRLSGLIIFLMFLFWPLFKFKGLFMFIPVWAVFEFFYRLRARQSLICPHCGFDPYLYKHDVGLARKKIEKFFEEKKESEKPQSVPNPDELPKEDDKKEDS